MADGFPNWKMTDRELLAFQMGWEKGKKDAVQRGKWIVLAEKGGIEFYGCSICEEIASMVKPSWNYCPVCGAKMG